MKTLTWIVGALAMALAVVLCGVVGYGGYLYGRSQVEEPTACVVTQEQPIQSVCPAPVVEPTPTVAVQQDFGPEMAFPSEVNGPAIAELWNPNTGFCALVKVNAGETLDWQYNGAWWKASDQEVLNVRWPHHLAEYEVKPGNAGCKIFTSAGNVPAQ